MLDAPASIIENINDLSTNRPLQASSSGSTAARSHREGISFAQERGGDQARPRLDGGRRARRPPHRLHRAADDQFDTFFRKASETHVDEIHH